MTAPAIQEAIFAAVRGIPAGKVASYGEIAARAGLPRRARLVGKLLREAPADLDLPWHRVLRADGRIAFPAGSESFVRQQQALEREGLTLRAGRVGKDAFRGDDKTSLDAELWGPGARTQGT